MKFKISYTIGNVDFSEPDNVKILPDIYQKNPSLI